MTDISVNSLVKSFEIGSNILDGLSFSVDSGEHVGILGPNGCGKTTLFRILTGDIGFDAGSVSVVPSKRMGLISQIPSYPEGYTVEDVLRGAQKRLYDISGRLDELSTEMETVPSRKLIDEYDRLLDDFRRLGGYEMDNERSRVANGLDIPEAMRAQLFDTLSGGEKTRVNLARLILEDTDILLLDEPTNHLDMHATEWLEEYLSHFGGTVLTVSHDRYFLDRVVKRCIEIVDGKAEFYSGNYSFFVAERQRRFDEKLKQYEKDQAKIEQLTRAAEQMHLWAFMGNDKLHKRAFSMEKRIERLSASEKPKEARKLDVRFRQKGFFGDEVASAENISKSYGDKHLFSGLSFTVTGGERIAVIGDNGTGKTTLMKMLNNEEQPDTGLIRLGPSVRKAYLPQIVRFDDMSRSLYDTMIYECKAQPQQARDRLAAFGFRGEDVFIPAGALSGGERSRLKLCMLMGSEINLLMLDEPTNHLDIASREWIESALSDYSETLIFVSHDRFFIDRFATRIWDFREGKVIDFRGTYSEYGEWKDRQEVFTRNAVRQQKKETPQKREAHRGNDRAIEKTEREIEKAESRLALLEKEAEEFASDYQKLMEIESSKASLQTELDALYEKWEALSS
ncbi:MAG: ABC-F family ATP-binding cassette domain-containing protein [Oscillospiraceae bacterium]|nr:ABC-F family ATP-binding cassette domain-containing protein [Oscillospiraceae bacterium]